MRRSSPSPAGGSNPAAPAAIASPAIALAVAAATLAAMAAAAAVTALAAAQGSAAVGSSSTGPSSHPPCAVTPAPRRYHTRVGPTPPSLPHPRPSRRAPPFKRARTSGLGESSSSRPEKPQSLPHQGPAGAPPLDLSPASIIWRPLFHCNPIPRNVDCRERDLHAEVHYDLLSFFEDPEL